MREGGVKRPVRTRRHPRGLTCGRSEYGRTDEGLDGQAILVDERK